MATHPVDILIRARDEASKQFGQVSIAASLMGSTIAKIAGLMATYFGVRAIERFGRESIELWEKQEIATIHLTSALQILGPVNNKTLKGMTDFATIMQRTTGIMDDEVLEAMKLGATIGHLSGESLKNATEAAIGLSKGFGIDLDMAMRIISKGAVGIRVGLARVGINIKDCKTEQELFNKVMETGIRNFRMATDEIEKQGVTTSKLGRAWHDVKESFGLMVSPVIKPFIGGLTQNLEMLSESFKNTGDKAKRFFEIINYESGIPKIVSQLQWMEEHPFKESKGLTTAKRYWREFWEREKALQERPTAFQDTFTEIEKSRWEKLADMIETAKNKLRDFGKTEEEIMIREARATNTSPLSLEAGLAAIRQTKYLEGQEKLKNTLKEMRDELATQEISPLQKKIYELKQEGIGGFLMGQLENLAAIFEKVTAPAVEKRGLPAMEASYLTRWPGFRLESYQRQTAESVKEQNNLTKRLLEKLDTLIGKTKSAELVPVEF